ncbi:Rho-binding antiterminator [Psychrosphaera sp. B3R10]|uniref:Rho-binding antiterminator n=1 Tax=Psychrosphaera algicola TaxID=3023714 RepID=A0ABT5FIV6_9GAMM|nr:MULTISPECIES: Rho-binding antiterminator [unclassified Psychrosphaera]MBU2882878.1 Rho-binding antiterminator [Psychrosphaera sp. I2R16]MBU2990383.1 Rho-binding antiterminator [Psychrosphaera sp. B3R10]MDC2891133.1 Rho-binding antiterminator [Psychrosphaera sp. G1-22]
MISCNHYDYIEIACMNRYPIKVVMKTGDVINGIALDTALNKKKQECIKIHVNNADRLVVLDNISTLEVSVKNPHFQRVSFD